MNKILLLILLASCTDFSKFSSSAHKNRKSNLFRDIHERVQNTINKIFMLLHLDSKFTADHNNQILLTLHAFMKTTSEKRFKGYSKIKRATKLSFKQNSKSGFNDYDNLTSLLVRQILKPNTMKYSDQANKTGIYLPLTSLKIPEKQEDSIKLLQEYFQDTKQTNSLNIGNLLKMLRSYVRKKNNNLEAIETFKNRENIDVIAGGADTRRVYKGKSVEISQYPFMASIHVAGGFVCAGSVISSDMVITAATCLHTFLFNNSSLLSENPQGIEVRVGSEYTQQSGELYGVSQIFFHPKYNIDNLHSNLAILRIDQPLYFTPKSNSVRRINYLKLNGDFPYVDQHLVLLGWGDKSPKISGTFDSLSFSQLKIFNQRRCKDIYSRKYVSDTNFCAGYIHKGSGACQRDVGGPAIAGDVLVGVVSFGPPVCGMPDAPTVFTNIGHYSPWIDSVLRKKSPIIAPTTTLPVVIKPKRYPNHFFKERSEKYIQKRKNKPIVVPRSQFNSAIEILKNILKKLTGGGKNLDDMMYEVNDSLDEGPDDGIVIGDDLYDNQENDQLFELETDEMRKENSEGINSLFTHKPVINDYAGTAANVAETINKVVSVLRGESVQPKTSGSQDPFFSALKNLGNYLGLHKFNLAPERIQYRSKQEAELGQDVTQNMVSSSLLFNFYPTTATADPRTDSLENPFRTKILTDVTSNTKNIYNNSGRNDSVGVNEIYDNSSTEVSDNYESESEGMSIEFKEEESNIIQRAHDVKGDEITATNAYETQIPQEYHDKAQLFLNKNFVKDTNASLPNLKDNNNNEELVVLLLKTSTQSFEIPKEPNKINALKLIEVLKQTGIKPSPFLDISDFNQSIQPGEKNNNKFVMPSQYVQTVLSDKDKIPIVQLRSFDELRHGNSSYFLLTISPDIVASTDTSMSSTNTDHSHTSFNNILTSTKPSMIYKTSTNHSTYNTPKVSDITKAVTTAKLITQTSGKPLGPFTSVGISTNNVGNTIKANEAKSIKKGIGNMIMASYEIEKELDDDEDNDDETDLDVRRRVLDYININ